MARKKSNKPQTPWEIAKPLLQKHYLAGDITDDMPPFDVWVMQPEFVDVKYENFRNNFASMKRTIKKHKERATRDEAGYLHDVAIYPLAKDTPGYWDGSEAQRLLKRDIKKKRHERMKPETLWMTRPQYQEFALGKFRGHIHQELRGERETNYWIVKQRKKQKAEEARRKGKRVDEDDMSVFYDPVLDM
jgi:hypothetical protein